MAPMGNRPEPLFVDDQELFDEFMDELDSRHEIAVDTEANAMHAYRPRLCLIQVSTEQRDFVVDPLADIDLDEFFDLLDDRDVTKIFHDAEFDILQFDRDYGVRLRGLFDTKVAAVALAEEQVGLAALVEQKFDVRLDKREQRSDWARRPLTERQLEYAAADTRYLLPLAHEFDARIDDADPIVRHECESEWLRLERLRAPELVVDLDAWQRIKGARRLDTMQLRALAELFAWREKVAAERDEPPFRIVNNAMLLEVAKDRPVTRAELEACVPRGLAARWGRELLTVVRAAVDMPALSWPKPEKPSGEERRRIDEDQLVYESLKRWRKLSACERPTDPSHVLNREVMSELAKMRPRPQVLEDLDDILEPWRIEAYGEGILEAIRKAEA